MTPHRSRRVGVLLAPVAAVAALALASSGSSHGTPSPYIASEDYDLGVRGFVQPHLIPRFRTMPIRLWGTIAVPQGRGPFPIILIAHGSHGDGCPAGPFDTETWACWGRMQRNDLGLRHIVKELARNGFVAVAPDFNAAFTGGWGESDPALRWNQVADAVLARIARANRGGVNRFGVPLHGKVDFARFGVLGHSRSGFLSQHWAWPRRLRLSSAEVQAGRGPVAALLQLAPATDLERPIVDVPMTVVLSQCDGDVGPAGRFIYRQATSDRRRTAPTFKVVVKRANHNFFNQTLGVPRRDDGFFIEGRPECENRLAAPDQRAWIRSLAVDVFDQALRRSTPAWMEQGAPFPQTLYGLRVAVARLYPRGPTSAVCCVGSG